MEPYSSLPFVWFLFNIIPTTNGLCCEEGKCHKMKYILCNCSMFMLDLDKCRMFVLGQASAIYFLWVCLIRTCWTPPVHVQGGMNLSYGSHALSCHTGGFHTGSWTDEILCEKCGPGSGWWKWSWDYLWELRIWLHWNCVANVNAMYTSLQMFRK